MSALRFQLDTKSLVPGSAAAIEVTGATAGEVLQAIQANTPFPQRPINLAQFGLEASGSSAIEFAATGKIGIAASGTTGLQLGVFDRGTDILPRLALEDADDVGLTFPDRPHARYALFLAGYSVQGKLSGSHPLGVLGAVTFGVDGARQQRYAVVHRFSDAIGARDVLSATFESVKLPRHVTTASTLAPATTVISEVDGSVAIQIGAQLGYDFNFVREAKIAGLQGDIGLKIQTGLKMAIGLEASGRYLLALERIEATSAIRLRLFKLRKKGWSFGLNLAARVQPVVAILPERADDLVKAIFGVQGQQVIKDLQFIERWTDPSKDLSELVAGLVNDEGLRLLQQTTGIDPRAQFNRARAALLDAIATWDRLPSSVSSLLWSELERVGLHGSARAVLTSALQALASGDPAVRRQQIGRLLSTAGIENDLAGRFLIAAADRGLAALLDDSEPITGVATTTLAVLNGGVIERLQRFISERLNLDAVRNAVTQADFDAIDGWLIKRLSAFLDKELQFENLDEARQAINLALRKRQEIYDKARQALTHQYDFDLAAKYQSATARTALIDATFDTSRPAAERLLAQIVQQSRLDELLTMSTDGVTLASAVLSHQITRRTTVEVHLPSYQAKTTTLTESLAKVTAQNDGDRVLFYELAASNQVAKNRLKSQLALMASVPVKPTAGLRVYDEARASWSYQFAQIAPNLRRAELETRLAPLALEYFPNHFPAGPSSMSAFLTDFDRAVAEVVRHGSDEFGDVLLSLDVSVPAAAIRAWFKPRSPHEAYAAARAASLRIQRTLQQLIPFYFFRDLDRLQQNMEAGPLLVFSALPPLNDFRIDQNALVPKVGPIWDVFDPAKRSFVVNSHQTAVRLATTLESERARLIAAGRTSQARFFAPEELRDFVRGVSDHPNFVNLLTLVSVASNGVERALDDLRGFDEKAGSLPSKAIERLAEFGAEIVSTFNERLSSVYGSDVLRPLGSLVFIETAAALDPTTQPLRPDALLSITVLKEARTYDMTSFLNNQLPPAGEIAIQQRLVTSS